MKLESIPHYPTITNKVIKTILTAFINKWIINLTDIITYKNIYFNSKFTALVCQTNNGILIYRYI